MSIETKPSTQTVRGMECQLEADGVVVARSGMLTLLLDLPSQFSFELEKIFGHSSARRAQLVHQLDDLEVDLMKIFGFPLGLFGEQIQRGDQPFGSHHGACSRLDKKRST